MLIENINVELEILAGLDSLALFFFIRSLFFDGILSLLLSLYSSFECFWLFCSHFLAVSFNYSVISGIPALNNAPFVQTNA